MAYALSIQKYTYTIPSGETKAIDFSQPLTPNPELNLFLIDFSRPDNIATNQLNSSEIHFLLNGVDNLIVYKDYVNKNIKYLMNSQELQGNFYDILANNVGIKIDENIWQSLIINCKAKGIVDIDTFESIVNPVVSAGSVEELKKQAIEGLSEEEVKKLERLRTLNVDSKNLEKEISTYQNSKKDKDDIKKNKEKLDQDLKSLEGKFASVNMLIESRDRLNSELQKFQNIVGDPSVKQRVNSIKEGRLTTLFSKLRGTKTLSPKNIESDENSDQPLLVAKWMLGIVILQIVVSLILFLLTFQVIQLFIGVFGSIIVILLMLMVNINRYAYSNITNFASDPEVITGKSIPVLVKGAPDEDRLILNNAWASALRDELDLINETINQRLGDKTLEQLNSEKSELASQLSETEAKEKQMESNAMTSEEYYKKRRELDILKIEKENIEFALENKIKPELEKQIEESTNPSENNNNKFDKLPLIIAECTFIQQLKDLIAKLSQSRQVIIINTSS